MGSIKADKLRAMKVYKQKSQFFYSLVVHCLIAVTCSLLCSYSYWFPSLYTIKHLLFMSLPNSCVGFFSPSCLFIVVNLIVVFLIGESRLSNGRQSSLATDDMYDEYLERSRSLRRPRPVLSKIEEKKEEMRNIRAPAAILDEAKEDNAKRIEEVEESKEDKHDDEEEFEECEANIIVPEEKCEGKQEEEEEKCGGKQEEEEEEKVEEKREEEVGMPAEELNKRVEDFIARVNRQRWLEARYLVCCKT